MKSTGFNTFHFEAVAAYGRFYCCKYCCLSEGSSPTGFINSGEVRLSFILFNFFKSGIDDIFPGGEISQGKIVQNVWQLNHLARIHDDVAVISFFFLNPFFPNVVLPTI